MLMIMITIMSGVGICHLIKKKNTKLTQLSLERSKLLVYEDDNHHSDRRARDVDHEDPVDDLSHRRARDIDQADIDQVDPVDYLSDNNAKKDQASEPVDYGHSGNRVKDVDQAAPEDSRDVDQAAPEDARDVDQAAPEDSKDVDQAAPDARDVDQVAPEDSLNQTKNILLWTTW